MRINGGALRTDTGGEWLELSGFSLGYELKRDIGEIREQPPTEDPVLLELGSDRIGAELTKALLERTHLANVEIEAYAEDTTGLRLVDEYRFTDVQFTEQSTSGGDGTNSRSL